MTTRHATQEFQALLDDAMAKALTDIAHEINQPLAAITNYALACERLLSMPEANVAEVQEALKEIAGQALRAGESIRRLREIVRNRKQASIENQAQSEKPAQ